MDFDTICGLQAVYLITQIEIVWEQENAYAHLHAHRLQRRHPALPGA
jgi:hypothetical protein